MAELLVFDLPVMVEATWSFRDSVPQWRHREHGSIGTFDPFPCYPHDRAAVDAAVKHVTDRCPPVWDVELFIADREETGRSNGFSNVHEGGQYVDGEWVRNPPAGLIVLSGKRMPPHPAVTRYLVAHEYGHNVEWMVQQRRYPDGGMHSDMLVREYAKLRGLADVHWGSGGRWHDSATEIFACDFRIIVCGVDPDYWPHQGITHPLELQDRLSGWWADAMKDLRDGR